ncbi:MAG: MlaC/ttg2D family ABC transporter substrate-binding protein [Magnetospiraceae bacterium]
MSKVSYATRLAVFVAFVFAFTAPAFAQDFGAGAKGFIDGLARDAVAALADKSTDQKEREDKFRHLLRENFAVKDIGQFVLGRYWRAASDEQKTEYLDLFEDFIIQTYLQRFDSYSGEKLKVIGAVADDAKKDAVVSSELMRNAGQPPIRIDWRVRAPDGAFKIVDVVVEGVSMSQTQRSDFGSVIQRNGGKIDGLIQMLRDKTAAMRNAG